MVSWLKYWKGYVRIKVWGFSPERFINLCGNRDILLWDIVKDGEAYFMCISLHSFFKLRPIARKTGIRIAVLGRVGVPFLIPMLYKRKIFVLGLIFTVAFWMISSFFIWDIDVLGNYQITDDNIAGFLRQNQIKIGMKKDSLDIGEMEKEIRRTFPQITWTSARFSGTRLIIEIKENDAPIISDARKQEEGADLIADYEGTIISMIVRKGVPKVKIGDQVEKKTVLVEGSVPVYNEDASVREYQYVRADADIIMEHVQKFRASIPFDYVEKEYTGRTKKRRYLRIREKEIGIPKSSPFLIYDTVIRESRPVLFEKLSIPVYFGCSLQREYHNVEHEYTLAQAKEKLTEKCEIFLEGLREKGVQIIEKNVRIDTKSGAWIIRGEFLVQEPVGVNVTISEQNVGESSADE